MINGITENESNDVLIPILDNDENPTNEQNMDHEIMIKKNYKNNQNVMENNLNSLNLILIVVGVLSIAFMVSLFSYFAFNFFFIMRQSSCNQGQSNIQYTKWLKGL